MFGWLKETPSPRPEPGLGQKGLGAVRTLQTGMGQGLDFFLLEVRVRSQGLGREVVESDVRMAESDAPTSTRTCVASCKTATRMRSPTPHTLHPTPYTLHPKS